MITNYNLFKENSNDYYTLYHGTSSNHINNINSKPTNIFLTDELDVAKYYAVKGGEASFLQREHEFEEKYGISPFEYFDTEENGEIGMYKSLYPKNEQPVVLKINIPKHLINNIDDFMGYKGAEMLIDPKYIVDIIVVNWDEVDV